jgi:hypothetical protein
LGRRSDEWRRDKALKTGLLKVLQRHLVDRDGSLSLHVDSPT